jgi:hypothetical protein
MSPATTIVRAHARHRLLALARGPLRPAFSLASGAVLPPPISAPDTAQDPACWTLEVLRGHRPDLLGRRQHRSDYRYRHSLTR